MARRALLYLSMRRGVDADTSPLPRTGFGPHQIQPPHLSIQICTLYPKHLGCVRDATAMVLEYGRDVVALEFGARLPQRGIEAGRFDVAFDLRVRENVLE